MEADFILMSSSKVSTIKMDLLAMICLEMKKYSNFSKRKINIPIVDIKNGKRMFIKELSNGACQ